MITKRGVKGSPLTGDELDANWDALAPKIVTVSEDTTLSDAHYTVRVDATDDDVVIALPSAASAFDDGYGQVYNIKKIDASANSVTVDGNAAETIDGAATEVLSAQWQSVVIQSDGTTWSVIYQSTDGGEGGGAAANVPLAPVDYLDENYAGFSSGFVDTTEEPYNSTATEGQSVICAYPNTPADAGIWVLGDVTNPAAVPVTRRADALVGTTFVKGQEILVGSSTPPSKFARCLPYDPGYNNWQTSGVIGTDNFEFDPGNASGLYSVASGGYSATASGDYSVASDINSTASGSHSVASSNGSTASGNYSVASGSGSTASGTNSVASGVNSVATGISSIASGAYSVANEDYAIARGYQTKARVTGSEAYGGCGQFATVGDAQCGQYGLKAQTLNDTPSRIQAVNQQLVLPEHGAFDFTGRLVAREPATGDSKSWKFEGLIKRGIDVSTTSLVGAVTPVEVDGDTGAAAWAVTVTADTSLGALAITVTGESGKTIQWVCGVNTVETVG